VDLMLSSNTCNAATYCFRDIRSKIAVGYK